MESGRISVVAGYPAPTTLRKVRQFLGMVSWYRRFVLGFSAIVALMTRLTTKNARWIWGEEQEKVFKWIKETLINAPMLTCPDFSQRFKLQTDASSHGLGAHHQEGRERIIAYASHTLNGAEKNYSATKLPLRDVGNSKNERILRGFYCRDRSSVPVIAPEVRRTFRTAGKMAFWVAAIWFRCLLSADALSKELEVCSIERFPRKCEWYRRIFGSPKSTNLFSWLPCRARPSVSPRFARPEFQIDPTEQWKPCISQEERAVLKRQHDSTAGHLGVAKTITRMARLYYWPGMFQDIYVRRCSTCLAHKVLAMKPAENLHTTLITAPHGNKSPSTLYRVPRRSIGGFWSCRIVLVSGLSWSRSAVRLLRRSPRQFPRK